MTASPDLDQHLAPARALPAGAPAFVRKLRELGMARFATLGFPTTRVEDWKYTNIAPIARERFALAPDGVGDATALAAGATLAGAVELVFVNGRFAPALSSRPALPAGVVIESLAAALAAHAALVEPHLGTVAAIDDDGVAALNTAFVQDGVFVHLPDGCALAAPIHCLFVSLANGTPTVTHPRVLIVAGAGSRASVIEQHLGRGRYWTNAVTEIVVGPGASLAHHKVQREDVAAYHLAAIAAAQAGDSRLTSRAIALGAGLSRSAIATRFDAAGAACEFDGLYIADGAQHVDHHTTIDHAHPRGTSRELYKGILAGRATGVFNGKVFVRPDAQQTDAQQMNQNLLLSDDAQIDTKPQLEIFADDVKCSHGATIGQLDDDAIFYLRARGVDEAGARRLLIYGFANELIERVEVEPLRRQLEGVLAERLPAVVGALP
jgi:Fe-S cluster assembly protein SufD